MKFAVCQIGARRHYAIPAMLERAGMLARLYTDGCRNAGLWRIVDRWFPRKLRPGLVRRMLERDVSEVAAERIITLDSFALWRAWRSRRCRTPDETLLHYAEANARFGRAVVARGLGDADAVYVFNAAGSEILQHAAERGLYKVVDQTMAPFAVVEPMLAEERDRWPGWERQRDGGGVGEEGWRRMADREAEEWALADRIICGSEYVADSVAQVTGSRDRCVVVPYGIEAASDATEPPTAESRPLRVLFAGTLGLRKGAPYLIEAAERLANQDVEFRAVGPTELADALMPRVTRCIDWRGVSPRRRMADHYRWADVLVLPTLAEGSANVCYEAMAHARPVITTPNAGSILRDGIDGYIIPIRDTGALVDGVRRMAGDRRKVCELGSNAKHGLTDFTWQHYESRLVEAVVPTNRADPSDIPPLL